jgi:hypothetical protein
MYYPGPRILLYVYGVVWCCAVDWGKVGGAGRSEGVSGAWNGCVMEMLKGVVEWGERWVEWGGVKEWLGQGMGL